MISKKAFWQALTISALSILGVEAAHAGPFQLVNETWIQGVWFKAGTTLTTFDQGKSPTPLQGTLARRFPSGDFIWEKDATITFDSQMRVISGTVASGTFADYAIQAGHQLTFYPNGTPRTIKSTQPIRILQYGAEVPVGNSVTLYPDGSISSATPGTGFVFEIGATGGVKRYNLAPSATQFWPAGAKPLAAGKVKQGTLAGDHADVYDVFPSGTVVGFDGAGEVNKLQCSSSCSYKSIVLKSGGDVEMLPSGLFTLLGKESIVVGTKTYPVGQKLFVTFEGTVIGTSNPQ